MELASDFRRWDELIPEALSQIFNSLSFKEKLTVIPMVCKPWSKVVMGSDCWREIDIEEWSNECQPQHLDRMIQMLVKRSGGAMRKLCVSKLQNDKIFSFIAEHANALQTLRLQRSKMSNWIVVQTCARFSNITFLDLSYCRKIDSPAIHAIGTNCKSLRVLCRNMHPVITGSFYMNDEVHAIAATMPRLKHLEIAYNGIDTGPVLEILQSCHELEFLDLRGCLFVYLNGKFFQEKFPKLKVLGPKEDLIYDENLKCYFTISDTYTEWTDQDLFDDEPEDEYFYDDYYNWD